MADISNVYAPEENQLAGPADQAPETKNPLNTSSLQKLRVVLAAPYKLAARARKAANQ